MSKEVNMGYHLALYGGVFRGGKVDYIVTGPRPHKHRHIYGLGVSMCMYKWKLSAPIPSQYL